MSRTPASAAAVIDRLLELKSVDASSVARAEQARDASGGRIDLALTQLGLVSERDVARAYADVLGLQLIREDDYPSMPVLNGKLSVSFLRTARMVPVAEQGGKVAVAVADPFAEQSLEAMRLALGGAFETRIGIPSELDAALRRLYASETAPGGPSARADASSGAVSKTATADMQRLRDNASEAVAVRLVDQLIAGAVSAGASDIHIEPFDGRMSVRYRIDGELSPVPAPDPVHHGAIIGRIKVLAGLDVAERRKPQDGRCLIAVEGRRIDLRVSLLPTLHGEGAVLRILDRERAPLQLDRLGFGGALRNNISDLIAQPHGIVLVCGPTGSGKTTTLYAILRSLQKASSKIVTVEDPIEYQIDGVNQIQVRPSIGMGFAEVLRSVLRHDPDVIMVGEARDAETGRVAVQAALTGHLVLCSLHTNDAPGAVTRMSDMGIEPYLLASTLRGVLAQRLVRRLCPECREPDPMAFAVVADAGFPDAHSFYRPVGCSACRDTGFSGRVAISEFLPATETIRELAVRRAASSDIRKAALDEGMCGLREDGLAKAAAGITSVQEVLRVTTA